MPLTLLNPSLPIQVESTPCATQSTWWCVLDSFFQGRINFHFNMCGDSGLCVGYVHVSAVPKETRRGRQISWGGTCG